MFCKYPKYIFLILFFVNLHGFMSVSLANSTTEPVSYEEENYDDEYDDYANELEEKNK